MISFIKTFFEPISLKITLTCLIWYAISSTTSQLTKETLNQFPYPIAVGQIQFFLAMTLCASLSVVVAWKPDIRDVFPKGSVPLINDLSYPIIISRQIFNTTLPMGMFQFVGKYFSLAATSLVPIASVSSIKALSPLLIVSGYRFYYGVRFPLVTYLSLTPLVVGVVFIVIYDSRADSVIGEINKDHIKGVLYAALSTLVFATQNIYAKKVVSFNVSSKADPASLAINTKSPTDLLPTTNMDLELERVGDKEKELLQRKLSGDYSSYVNGSPSSSTLPGYISMKPDKVTILMYCSLLGFIFSLPAFLINDLPKLLSSDTTTSPPYLLLLLNGTSHFLQALMAFHILGITPTVTYSIASMLKRILIITVSMFWVGHTISGTQWLGLILIGTGLYCYDRWGSKNL